jgi:gliding motility-associated-like protein
MSSVYRHLLLALFCLLSIKAEAQVNANFTANYTEGCAPLVVTFTNLSTNAISYSWDLGNSTISSQTNPQTSYLTPGTYTVILTATGSNNTTSTHTMTITVHPPPVVNFVASPTAGCPGTTVQFTDQSNLIVPGPGTYLWDFGNGNTSPLQNPTETFYASGSYNISLFVTNDQGCTAFLTLGSYITIYTPPTTNVAANNTFFCTIPATVNFTNTSTGTQPISYQWDFGDGNIGTGTTPTHTYANFGTYTVTVIATDGNGCKDTLVLSNYINVVDINADFTAPDSVCVHTPVSFTNTSSAHQSRTWNFGDLNTSTQVSPTHTYAAAGTYNVMLAIQNGPCVDTIIKPIVVVDQPPVDFTIDPGIVCPPPSTIQLTGSAPPGSSYLWDFGIGGSNLQNPTVTYSTTGVKFITLIATSPFGCKDTVTKTDTIYNSLFDMWADPDSGCVPLDVAFYTTHWTTIPTGIEQPYPSPIVNWVWNFGDGSGPGSGPTPTHTYTNTGYYYPTVTVTTANGCTFTDTMEIRVGVPPVAGFTVQPEHVCYNDPVSFTNTSTGATGYFWIFGDGATLTGTVHPSHIYINPGFFTPILIAYNNGCPDTFVYPNIIQVDSPKAIIDFVFLCNPRTAIQFTNNSLGDDWFLWDFGDGDTTSQIENPLHNYTQTGIYNVTLYTWNFASNCRDTTTTQIYIYDVDLDINATDTAICPGETVVFTPVVTNGIVLEYTWLVNGVQQEDDPTFTYTFWTPGFYDITLNTVDGNGCTDTYTANDFILVAKPVASFDAVPPSGCVPLSVTFNNTSTDQPGTTFTNFEWDFGDGNTANVTVPTVGNTYWAPANFAVQMIVTDNVGCKDTATGIVSAIKPNVAFIASNTHPCIMDSVTFTNYSTGNNLSYQWDFGDGNTSTLHTPKHAYAEGTYTVTLIAIDANGCSDTFIATNYIVVSTPVAAFTLDSIAVCPPLVPNIQNASTGASSYFWDLGNGNTATTFNPSVTYVTSGAYDIMLVASNAWGCRDTVIHTATIYGFGGAFNYTPLEGCAPLTVLFQANLSNVPSITWDFNDGTVATTSATDTITHTYQYAGFYLPKLILSDGTGCQTSNPGLDTIKVDSLIMGFYANSPCINSIATFVDTSHGLFTSTSITSWWWQFHDGVTSTDQSPTHYYGPSGSYPVTLAVTSSTGCQDTIESEVFIRELPIITAMPDTTVCVGDPATLYAWGGVSYLWSPDDGTLSCTACDTPTATPAVEAIYIVEGTDVYGCKNVDSVRVLHKTKTESIGEDAEVCLNDTVMLSVTQAQVWAWSPSAGLSDTTVGNPLASPDTTTTYTIITRDGTCEPDTVQVTVTVNPLPVVDLGPDLTITGGASAELHASGTNIYQVAWMPYNTLSCDSCMDPIATPKVSTAYTVYAFTDKGCKDTSDIMIYVICDNSQIFIPTVFTPNGDNQNDIFYPRGKGISLVKTFRIYNRWGELIFDRSNFQLNDEFSAWDGRFKGDEPRSDVYVYIIEAVCDTGEPLFFKGDVTLMR